MKGQGNQNLWPGIIGKFKAMFGGQDTHKTNSLDIHNAKEAGEPGTEIDSEPDDDTTKPDAPSSSVGDTSMVTHPKLKMVMAKLNGAMPEDEEDKPAGRFAGISKNA